MKLLALMVLSIMMVKNCTSQSKNDTINATITYTARSRGFFQKIHIENRKVVIFNEQAANQQPLVFELTNTDWQELKDAFYVIDLEKITRCTAPTQKRFHDGAAIANLTISMGDKEYKTVDFDHGNPPEMLQKLVSKMTTLAGKNH